MSSIDCVVLYFVSDKAFQQDGSSTLFLLPARRLPRTSLKHHRQKQHRQHLHHGMCTNSHVSSHPSQLHTLTLLPLVCVSHLTVCICVCLLVFRLLWIIRGVTVPPPLPPLVLSLKLPNRRNHRQGIWKSHVFPLTQSIHLISSLVTPPLVPLACTPTPPYL